MTYKVSSRTLRLYSLLIDFHEELMSAFFPGWDPCNTMQAVM